MQKQQPNSKKEESLNQSIFYFTSDTAFKIKSEEGRNPEKIQRVLLITKAKKTGKKLKNEREIQDDDDDDEVGIAIMTNREEEE